MITELQNMYGKPPGVELQELVNMFHSCKQAEGQSVSDHVVESRKPQPYKKEHPAKDGQCHHCKEEGHWKRNCPVYLAELMKKKKKTEGQNVASTSSSIYTIELFAFPKNSWVYDTGCGTHICNTKHGLRGAKKLKHGSLYLYVGNGVRAEVEAIGSFDLVLPNACLCGSALRHVSKKGASYFITFTDDYSRYGYVYLLKHKHEVFEAFKVFKNEVENQLGKTIKAIRSDRGAEYISQEFKDYLKAYGIVQQLTPPYTPQHNESAARILNMVPTKKVDKTPYELWHGKVPNLSYLKVWGCEAHVKCHTPDKLQQRSVKCIFVGYPKETMGYYFYYPPENKIVVERYADFLENDFILQKESGRNVELDDEDILPSENTSEHPIEEESLAPIVSQEEDGVPVHRFVRTHKAPDRLCLNVEIDPDRLSFNIEVEEHSLGDLNELANYKAALSDPEFEKWFVAMNEEMQSMNDNNV
ncbi:retrotransposon protein, putative, ty1-copia subclass [Tanacetum coccineum]